MHSKLWPFILFILGVMLAGCAASAVAQSPTPDAAPTNPPPPPQLQFTPVPDDVVSPVVIQRVPRRGEELPAGGVIELVFDRAMDESATASAFSLQQAAEPPQPVSGRVTWADGGRTLRFT
ncbi:MAG: hypothetical protein D6768_15115, partial [Chloroflexi bacterium]